MTKTQVPSYSIGDSAWVYCQKTEPGLSPKLCRKWTGPYYIVEKKGPYTYMLRQGANNRIMKSPVHANRLKHFLDSATRPTNPPNDLQKLNSDINSEEIEFDQSKDTEEHTSGQPKEVSEEKVIEKILSRSRRGDWYRVKYTNRKFKPEWLL